MNDLIERLRLGDGTSADHELLLEAADALEALAQPERDYERGFIDGMQHQMQSSVDKAVNAMTQPTYYIPNKDERTWAGLTDEEIEQVRLAIMGVAYWCADENMPEAYNARKVCCAQVLGILVKAQEKWTNEFENLRNNAGTTKPIT